MAIIKPFALFFLVAAPLWAKALVPGEAYELELSDGSRLVHAVYRGEENGASVFDVAALSGTMRINNYRVIVPRKPLPWAIAIVPGYLVPLNQRELGFTHGLGIAASGSIPILAAKSLLMPRLYTTIGFSRYSGRRALLSGPELTSGPQWILPWGQNFFGTFALAAGVAFYELLNLNLNNTFTQTTLLVSAELGIGWRRAHWGVALSYIQHYIHDEKLPFTTGGIRLGAVYFGGTI